MFSFWLRLFCCRLRQGFGFQAHLARARLRLLPNTDQETAVCQTRRTRGGLQNTPLVRGSFSNINGLNPSAECGFARSAKRTINKRDSGPNSWTLREFIRGVSLYQCGRAKRSQLQKYDIRAESVIDNRPRVLEGHFRASLQDSFSLSLLSVYTVSHVC